jgi:AcrR family transcriptional regulator
MTAVGAPRVARTVGEGRPDRRQNILEASQRLFARFGYHAVTIRQIAAEAGVPLALVGYYFGQKQELYDAIFGQLSGTLEERRAGLYAALNDHSGDPLAKIVEAMVVPVTQQRSTPQGEAYALFVSRGLTQQNEEEDRAIREYFDPLASEFIEAMHDVLVVEAPLITQAQATWCFQFALGALLHFLSDQRVARLSKGVNIASDPAVVPQLQAFIVSGIRGAVRSFVAASTPSTAETV